MTARGEGWEEVDPVESIHLGRLLIAWWPPRARGWGFHAGKCCWFWLELWALEIRVAR